MNANIFFSSPELRLRVFNFLPFDSIKSLGQVSRVLNSVYRKVIHPSHIGIFPTSIWSNHIFPLLSYHQLKGFQRVNQASRALTLSKPLSEIMLRSDVSSSKLKQVKVGEKLSKESYEEDDKGNMLRILYSGIHPFFGAISYSLGMDYEDVYIMTGTTFSSGEPEKTHNIALYKTRLDNATHPPVSSLLVELKDPKQHFVMLDSKRTIKVVGTGRPIFGGKDRAVTVQDVMKAFCKDGAKVKCESERETFLFSSRSLHFFRFHLISRFFAHFGMFFRSSTSLCYDSDQGDHVHFEGFTSLEKTSKGFRLGQVSWGS